MRFREQDTKWLTASVSRSALLARRFFDRFEPVHAVTYFAPEVQSGLTALGFTGFWRGYFAARSAPLGPVPAEVVTAIFYNFAAHRVAKSLAGAWDIATPQQALAAREAGAVAALRRYGLTADDTLRPAADLLGRVARGAAVDGRPLFAALSAAPWPDEPVAQVP